MNWLDFIRLWLQWIEFQWAWIGPYYLKCLEMTIVVIWRYINKTELNWIEFKQTVVSHGSDAAEQFQALEFTKWMSVYFRTSQRCIALNVKHFKRIKNYNIPHSTQVHFYPWAFCSLKIQENTHRHTTHWKQQVIANFQQRH